MLVTCFCILAVDFSIYPRRYAKTETYGTSVVRLSSNTLVMYMSYVYNSIASDLLVYFNSLFHAVLMPPRIPE